MANTKDEWWRTTPAGRRIGWLQPSVFHQRVTELAGGECVHGTHAPLIRFSLWIGVGKSTVYRWADGTDPIPKWVALLLEAMRQIRTVDKFLPVNVEANWLPFSDGANGRHRPATPLTGETDKLVRGVDYHTDSDLELIEAHGINGLNFSPSTPPEYR